VKKEVIEVEINTFSAYECERVFKHLCEHVIKRTPFEVKKKVLRMKKGEKISWDHIIILLERYGCTPSLLFRYDPACDGAKLSMSEINYERAKRKLQALPMPSVDQSSL
jgi:hypothetical protein